VHWRQVVVAHAPPGVRFTGQAARVAAYRGSSGQSSAFLEVRGDLLIAEVWLLP